MIYHSTEREFKTTQHLESFLFLQKRIIFLTGKITDELSTTIIQQILYLADMNKRAIKLYINSPGGSTSAGLAIYDTLKNCGCEIITECTGIAAGIATVLLASGTYGKRYCSAHSMTTLYLPNDHTETHITDIELHARQSQQIRQYVNTLFTEVTGQCFEKISIATTMNEYMTAEQTIEYGIVDHISVNEIT